MSSNPAHSLVGALQRQLPSTLLRMLVFVGLGHLVAQQLGAAGVAVWGQAQNLIGLGVAAGTMALQSGFQQGIAQRAEHPRALAQWNTSGLVLGGILSVLSGVLLLGAVYWHWIALPESVLRWTILLPLALPFWAIIGSWQGNLLGHQNFGLLARWTTLSGLLQALWIGGLCWLFGLSGLAFGLLTQTLFAFPFARALLGPLPWNWPRHLKVWLHAWWPFLLAGLVPALLAPLGSLVLRDLALQSGWSAAGQWQAAIRLTDLVAQLWNGAVASWLLSHVAKQPGRESIRKPLWIATAGMAILCVCLAICAPLALWVAYGNGFADAVPLLRWQILSEVPRTLGWLLTTALIARKRLKQVMVLDLLGTLLMVGLAYALHAHLELRALPIASFLENLVFAGCALWLWKRTPR